MGILIFLSSFIPIFGNAGVWIPIAISKIIFNNQIKEGILLGISCLIFVTLLDYFLRPVLLKLTLNLHPFLIFLSMLGGIYTFWFIWYYSRSIFIYIVLYST